MGRPINKKYLGDVAGAIKVSNYRRAVGIEVVGEDDTYIVSQRSTNKFLIADTSGGWQEVLTLVDKEQGSLLNGEFQITGTDAEGNLFNVVRLYNRTLRLGNADGTFEKAAWSINAPSPRLVTGVTLDGNDPVVIGVASTAGLTEGDVVRFFGFDVTVELNTGTYVVANIVADTSFELAGTDSSDFTDGVNESGLLLGIGDTAFIERQAT